MCRFRSTSKWVDCWFFISTILMIGCADSAMQENSRRAKTISSVAASGQATAKSDGELTATPVSVNAYKSPTNRRIVYDANVSMVVDSYQDFESELIKLIDQSDGFVARSESNRRYANRLSGVWEVRIPVDQYTEFLTEMVTLGVIESKSESAQDVTAEYVDVEARIQNNQQLEKRVLQMLEERSGKLADVLEIERELARVREEIERMQGQLRVLTDQTSLATITIDVREDARYIPAADAGLTAKLATTWKQSLAMLKDCGQWLLIAVVAVFPWAVATGLFASIFYFTIRTLFRRFT